LEKQNTSLKARAKNIMHHLEVLKHKITVLNRNFAWIEAIQGNRRLKKGAAVIIIVLNLT